MENLAKKKKIQKKYFVDWIVYFFYSRWKCTKYGNHKMAAVMHCWLVHVVPCVGDFFRNFHVKVALFPE